MKLLGQKGSATSRPTLGQVLQRMNLGLALIAVSAAGIFLTLLALFALRAYANHNLHLIARSISYTAEAAVVFEDRPAAREALMLIASNEEVSEAKILDMRGSPWPVGATQRTVHYMGWNRWWPAGSCRKRWFCPSPVKANRSAWSG